MQCCRVGALILDSVFRSNTSIVQVTLTAWAVFYRNTIQIVGLAIFNALLLVYAAIQVGEIAEVFRSGTPYADSQVSHRIFSLPTKILSGLVIAVIAAAEIAIIILAWFIWREFGWRIYRFLGADLQIRRYYRQYQIFECILCFSFFFFVGFSVQVSYHSAVPPHILRLCQHVPPIPRWPSPSWMRMLVFLFLTPRIRPLAPR